LALAASAADREDAVDKHPVTPGEVLPARELYADMLLALERNDAALEQYRRVLDNAPNRYNTLLGAARSAAASRQSGIAAGYYEDLVAIAAGHGSARESLDEAVAFIVDSGQ
jgi:hypothetical protein